jgi:hypothetical protein
MSERSGVRSMARWATAGIAIGAASWAAYAGITWIRYGRARRPTEPEETDPLLDRFMPVYEAADRHRVRVAAPMEMTFAAATALDLQQSAMIRAIFKGRELMLGAQPEKPVLPRPLLDWAKVLGWGVLVEVPGREIIFGAVTKPWEAKVVFRSLPPEEFAAFQEPGYVKIVWTLRAERISAGTSMARTETRVTTTGPIARAKFRRYWAFLSPGIRLIRRIALKTVKQEAERLACQAGSRPSTEVEAPAERY